MDAPAFNEITTLKELQNFVKKAEETGTVKAGWRGREIAVGNQTVSEKTIWERFEKLQRDAPATKQNVESTELCKKHLTLIHNQDEKAPWYVRWFRTIFFFITEPVNLENNLKTIDQLVKKPPSELEEKERARLEKEQARLALFKQLREGNFPQTKEGRITMLREIFEGHYPQIQKALDQMDDEMEERDIEPLATAIVEDILLSNIGGNVRVLRLLLLPPPDSRKYTPHHRQLYDNLQRAIKEKLQNNLPEKMTKELPKGHATIWKKVFDKILKSENVLLSEDESKIILQPAEIKKALDLLITAEKLFPTLKDASGKLKNFVTQNARPTQDLLTKETIGTLSLTADEQKFAETYLTDPQKFNEYIKKASSTDKSTVWNQALDIVSKLYSHEETKPIAIQLLMHINPPSYRPINAEEWENDIIRAENAQVITRAIKKHLFSPFAQKAITYRSEYQKVDKELLSKTFLFSQFKEDDAVNKILFQLGLLPRNIMVENTAKLFLNCLEQGKEQALRNFEGEEPPDVTALSWM